MGEKQSFEGAAVVIPSGAAKRRSRGIALVPVEGLRSLYREEEETKTQITRILQKNADSPSTKTVATLARPSFLIESFCAICEICGYPRQVFSG